MENTLPYKYEFHVSVVAYLQKTLKLVTATGPDEALDLLKVDSLLRTPLNLKDIEAFNLEQETLKKTELEKATVNKLEETPKDSLENSDKKKGK